MASDSEGLCFRSMRLCNNERMLFSVGDLIRSASPDSLGRYLSTEIALEVMLELRDLYTPDAFMALLLLAREAKLIKSEQRFVLATTYAFEVFPCVVMTHVHLHVCWERLHRCVRFATGHAFALKPILRDFPSRSCAAQLRSRGEIPSRCLRAPPINARLEFSECSVLHV